MNFNYIESLVAKAKNGDVSSKEIIFKEFRPMILNISKRIFVHGYDFSDIDLISIFWTQKVKLFYAALLANNSHCSGVM